MSQGFAEQKLSLQDHMKVQLDGWPVALTLAIQTLSDVTLLFSWFVPELEEY